MAITATRLTQAAGVCAAVAGAIFIGVNINHPHVDVASITTTELVIRNSLKVLMCALALAGITGMYLSQVRRNGVLGLIGYLVLAIGYLLIMSTTFVAAYVLPSIAATDPAYVKDVLAVVTGGTATGSRASPTSPAASSSASRCTGHAFWPGGRPCSSRSVGSSAPRSR
jgi:hypothetical protein